MINKKIVMVIGMVLLVAGMAYVSAIVLFGGNAYESNEDKLVLDIDLTQANYVSGTKTFADDSGEGNDGVSNNAANFTTDKYGMSTGAMSFNGSGEYVDTTYNFSGMDEFSVSTWVYINSETNYKTIWSADDTSGCTGEGLYFSSGNYLNFRVANDLDTYILGDITGAWHHIVALQNTTNKIIYIDGVLNKTFSFSGTTVGSVNFQIANYNACVAGTNFNGSISQVKIYNRSLSAAEVGALYESSKPKISAGSLSKGLIGHWELDSESYNSATDRVADKTPYSNHGVNYGATLTTDQMGQSNRAMYFDGGSDYVNLGDSVLYNSSKPVTVAFWAHLDSYNVQYPVSLLLKTEQATGFVFFYCAGGSYNGFNFGSNLNFVRLKTEGTLGPGLAGEWNNFVMVYDGVDRTVNTSYKLYLNNIEQSLVVSGAFAVAPLVNNISTPVSNNQFNGSISDLRIYDRNLSADDVDTLYHSYRPKAASGSLYKGLVLDMPLTSKYITGDVAGSEVIRDRTPYSNDGQNYGATVGNNYSSFVPNDYLNISDDGSLNITGSMTLGLWLNLNTLLGPSNYQDVVLKWNNAAPDSWALVTGDASGEMEFWWVDGGNDATGHRDSTNANLQVDQWYYISVVYNQSGPNITLYKNGQQLAYTTTGSLPSSLKSSTDSVTFGKRTNSNSYALNGSISSAKIYNRALSESEIKLLYIKGR